MPNRHICCRTIQYKRLYSICPYVGIIQIRLWVRAVAPVLSLPSQAPLMFTIICYFTVLNYAILIFQVHVQFNRSGNKNGRFASDHFYRTFNVLKYAFCSLVILKLSTLFWIVLLCTHGASLFSSRYGRTDLYCFARAVAKYHAIIILT